MSPITKVFQKETKEMMRDKRVRSTALFTPFLLMVMMIYLFGSLENSLTNRKNIRVHVVAADKDLPFVQRLRDDQAQIIEVESLDAGRELVAAGKARVVLDVPEDYDQKLTANQPSKIVALFDSKAPTSLIALNTVKDRIEKDNSGALDKLLVAHGIPVASKNPAQVEPTDVAPKEETVNELILSLLPYVIIVWAFYGGMSIATDLVAGEKEKNTLETLLISPVRRTQIVAGKFLALCLVCFLSSVSCLLGLVAMSLLKLPGTERMFQHGLGVTPLSALVVTAVLIPTVTFFASMLIAISSYAKNPREAQTYLASASFVVLMPALMSQFIGFMDFASARWVSMVPVLNTATSIRQALLSKFDWVGIGLTIGISAVLAIIGIKIAVTLFNREQVLTRV